MKPRPAPEPESDRVQPTPERFQHDHIEHGEVLLYSGHGVRSTSKALAHRVRTQRVIDRLLMHETITETQHKAAERLWRLTHAARMVGLAKVNPIGDRVSGGAGAWSSLAAGVEAREEVKDALRAVPARLRAILRWVVVDDLALRYCAARRAGRAIGGREVAAVAAELGEGLDALVRFWRL